jgi:hypothetical protein
MREGMLNGIDVNHTLELGAIFRFQESGGICKRILHADQRLNADIHFEHGEAARHAVLEFVAHGLAGRFIGRVTIDTDGVAEFTARQDIGRNTVGLACQVHQRHLDAAHAPALPRMMTELFDLAKDFIHIAGILADQPAFEHQCVCFARTVTHFAIATQALIRINADDGKPPPMPADSCRAYIRDS